jgi:nucleoside phosphorylase
MPGWDIEACIGDLDVGEGRYLSTCLACVGEMGIAPTTAVVAQAISTFRPRMVAMLGMCCGFNDQKCGYPQKLGNVLVVREVSCWEEGKYVADGSGKDFRSRSKSRYVSERLRRPVELVVEKKAEHIDKALARLRKKKWVKDLITRNAPLLDHNPEVRFAEIVTGSSFVANATKIAEIVDAHNSAVGLDMEIFGVYAAPDFVIGSRPLRLAVKGVADFGDGKDKPEIQVLASVAAAVVFKEILAQIDLYELTSTAS